MITKEEKILSKFYDIGATEIKIDNFGILVCNGLKDEKTLNYKSVIRIEKREKTYEKCQYLVVSTDWRYQFYASLSCPITEAEHSVITELFDYWREEEWNKKQEKQKS